MTAFIGRREFARHALGVLAHRAKDRNRASDACGLWGRM